MHFCCVCRPHLAPSFSFKVDLGEDTCLTDDLLTLVLQMGPHVHSLHAASMYLESDQHRGAVWPWQELVVKEVNMTSLANLPDASGGVRVIATKDIMLDESLTEVCRYV